MESFGEWYVREHDRMIATLVLTTGDLDLATDGVDEACSRALERWTRVREMDSPTGWIYRVALNHVRRAARRRSIEQRIIHRSVATPVLPEPASEIWHVVSRLAPRQRQVVVLRHVAQMTEAEIGAALGISRGTVSSTLRDAHHRLGRLLDDDIEEEKNV